MLKLLKMLNPVTIFYGFCIGAAGHMWVNLLPAASKTFLVHTFLSSLLFSVPVVLVMTGVLGFLMWRIERDKKAERAVNFDPALSTEEQTPLKRDFVRLQVKERGEIEWTTVFEGDRETAGVRSISFIARNTSMRLTEVSESIVTSYFAR